MMSLKTKILGATACIVVVVVSLFTASNHRLEKRIIDEIVTRDARILTETIRNSISNSMRHGRSDEVGSILSNIKSEESIRSIRIIDETGKVLNSANSSEISTTLPFPHSGQISADSSFLVSPTPQNGTYVVLARINNTPACYGCHSPQKKTLGILHVQLSFSNLESLYARLRQNTAFSALILTVLLITTFSLFLIRYVDRPLRTLSTSMRRLENGDFDCHVTITSSREMNQFGEHFNTMLHRLRRSIDHSMEQERLLVKREEQLAHHDEMKEMNRQLELQVAEIESLNASLRKKLEELEEANYKISDLASELEDKNTVLETTVSRLSTLYRIGLGINATMEMKPLLDLIIRNTMETVRAETGYILFRGPGRDQVTIKHLSGETPGASTGIYPLDLFTVSRLVMETGKPALLNGNDRSFAGVDLSSPHPLGLEWKAFLCAPLRIHRETIGTIVLINKEGGAQFDSDDMDLVSTIASQASIAIKNALLYDELQTAYFNTIQALVSAIEASDSYTRGHSERVTRYALNLARRLNHPPERLKVLEKAAILHDIGKIGIDLSLLHKTGQLTQSDVQQLRLHPVIGMKILDPISFLNDVKICIGQHHERFDGTGYPYSLPPDELLLESRILAIADAFDAMTSDRPYRRALSVETALRELQNHAGTQFDPVLVPIFVEMIRDDSPDRMPLYEGTGEPLPLAVDSPPGC